MLNANDMQHAPHAVNLTVKILMSRNKPSVRERYKHHDSSWRHLP